MTALSSRQNSIPARMRFFLIRTLLLKCFLFTAISGFCQIVENPSFEGVPQAAVPPDPWHPCNEYSTPDTQPGLSTVVINVPASDGDTYISLLTRGIAGYINDATTEAVGTRLLSSLQANTCYNFSLDLAYSPAAYGYTTFGDFLPYYNAMQLIIWGGDSECHKQIELWRSPVITHSEWRNYSFVITVPSIMDYLILEAMYPDDNKVSGNILVDNIKLHESNVNIDIGEDMRICSGDSILLQIDDYDEILWSNGSSENKIIAKSGDVIWVQISEESCYLTDTLTIYRSRSPDCCTLEVPNVFTPNGDEFNNVFFLSSPSRIKSFLLQIYNRWGKLVYSANNINEFWTGENAGSGTYYWIVTQVCGDKEFSMETTHKGYVTVVR